MSLMKAYNRSWPAMDVMSKLWRILHIGEGDSPRTRDAVHGMEKVIFALTWAMNNPS